MDHDLINGARKSHMNIKMKLVLDYIFKGIIIYPDIDIWSFVVEMFYLYAQE